MTTLSSATIVTIITALRTSRDDDMKIVAEFEELARIEHASTAVAACLTTAKDRLEHNGAALRELAQAVAPWIKSYPELKSVFEQA